MRLTTTSIYLPDFPLNPLCQIPEGARLEGEHLTGVCFVGILFCIALGEWRDKFDPPDWPMLADDELEAIGGIFKKVYEYDGTPPPTHLGGGLIPRLAASYIERFFEFSKSASDFNANRITVYGIMVDFAGTLGYESSLRNVLDGYEAGVLPLKLDIHAHIAVASCG